MVGLLLTLEFLTTGIFSPRFPRTMDCTPACLLACVSKLGRCGHRDILPAGKRTAPKILSAVQQTASYTILTVCHRLCRKSGSVPKNVLIILPKTSSSSQKAPPAALREVLGAGCSLAKLLLGRSLAIEMRKMGPLWVATMLVHIPMYIYIYIYILLNRVQRIDANFHGPQNESATCFRVGFGFMACSGFLPLQILRCDPRPAASLLLVRGAAGQT